MVTSSTKRVIVWMLTIMLMFTMGFGSTLQYTYAEENTDQVDNGIIEQTEDEATVDDETEQATEEESEVEDEAVELDEADEAIIEGETAQTEEVEEETGEYSKQDEMAYNFIWIQNHANSAYVNVDSLDLESFAVPAALAKGVATYNVDAQRDFDVTETNYIASVTYEIPLYDIDANSKYYVAMPDVNMGDSRFGTYDFMMAYNNEYAEMVDGYKFEDSIAYVPKSVVDRPKNDEELVEGDDIPIGMQMNYYFKKDVPVDDGDMVFTKNVPVTVLSGEEQDELTIKNASIFESYISAKTGVVGAEKVSVFLNGTIFPVKDEMVEYDSETGEVAIAASPATISNINIVFEMPSAVAKLRNKVVEAVHASVASDKVVKQANMKKFKTQTGKYVTLDIAGNSDIYDKLFIGWRGNYASKKVVHTNNATTLKGLKGFTNSLKYLYGGYMSGNGMDISTTKKKLNALWAISSYNLGTDVVTGKAHTKTTKIKKSNNPSTTKKTIYKWMMTYRNTLEKASANAVGDQGNKIGSYGGYNGLGGRNNFAFRFPSKIYGSSKNLVPKGNDGYGQGNPDITLKGYSNTNYIAASCTHLGKEVNASDKDGNNRIYVTCIGLTKKYIVLAFTTSNRLGAEDGQSATAIYKFAITTGQDLSMQIKKEGPHPEKVATEPEKYSLANAEYAVFDSEEDAETAGTAMPEDEIEDPNGSGDVDADGDDDETGGDYDDDDSDPEDYDSGQMEEGDTNYESEDPDADPDDEDTDDGDPVEDGRIATFKTGEDGLSNIIKLDSSITEVWLKEMKGPDGTAYAVDPSIKHVKLPTSTAATFTYTVEEPEGRLHGKILKKSADESITSGSSSYSLADAVFAIYATAEEAQNATLAEGASDGRLTEATTRSNGEAEYYIVGEDGETQRTVYIREVVAPKGYGLVSDVKTGVAIDMESDAKPTPVEFVDPVLGAADIVVVKADRDLYPNGINSSELATNEPSGKAGLAGAEFKVEYFDGDYDQSDLRTLTADKKWTVTTDEHGKATLENIPEGTLRITEVNPPEGYLASDMVRIINVRDGVPVVVKYDSKDSSDIAWIGDYPIRKDIYFIKEIDESDGQPTRFENCPFLITSKTTGESHVVVTDPNGVFDSSNLVNTNNTNKNDEALNADGTVDQSKLNYKYGVWFSQDKNGKTSSAARDGVGSFNYDDYKITELKCAANEDLKLATINKVSIYENGTDAHPTVNVGTITNYRMGLSTLARDKSILDHITYAGDSRRIVDRVHYEGVQVGEKYSIKGWAVDVKTGEKVAEVPEKTESFTAKLARDDIDIEYKFDGTALEGRTIVFFEELYDSNGKLMAAHKDASDEDQFIYLPKIRTTEKDSRTLDHETSSLEAATITDTVKYEDMLPGGEITFKGWLVDKETGEPVKEDGKEITAEKKVIIGEPDGSETLTFKFDATKFEGKTFVVYEEAYFDDDYLIADHKDINDADQTVYVPQIRTLAKDKLTNDHEAYANGEVNIIDTVSYKSLLPGKEHTISGILMDQDTKKPFLVDGKEVTSTVKFTPESPDGTVEIPFTFDGSEQEGHLVVAFETLTYNGVDTAKHENITDTEQFVYLPKIRTLAKDSITDDHEAWAHDEVTIIDTVSYDHVLPGVAHVMKGVLMDKDTGKPFLVDGKEVTGEIKFTPRTHNGTVQVRFRFNGDGQEGHLVVAYETLTLNDHVTATHQDIEDESQFVYLPKIRTLAKDKITDDHEAWAHGEVTIIDTVSYDHVLPNVEHTMTGILMDKDTGKPFLVDGKEVTNTVTFTPENPDGKVQVPMTFNGDGQEGHLVVAYETLKLRGEFTTAVHENIEDEEQFVYLPKIRTLAKDKRTEEHEAYANGEITIIDTVSYDHVLPNVEHTMTGILMDKDTGKPFLVDGKEVTNTVTFTPETPEGKIQVPMTFNGDGQEGHLVVAFETLKLRGEFTTAVHEDIEDEEQFVYIPRIRTSAVDKNTQVRESNADDSVTIVDTITYDHMMPTRDFVMKGTMMQLVKKESADDPYNSYGGDVDNYDVKPLVDAKGKAVTGETKFKTTDTGAGTVDVTFEFDGSLLEGETIVVYEQCFDPALKEDVQLIADHQDPNDEKQIIHIPKIRTVALGDDTNLHMTTTTTNTSVTDTVKYWNVIPGLEHTMVGILMDKDTNEPLLNDGKIMKAEGKFTPESADGEVKITFSFNGKPVEGHKSVAFETMYVGDETGKENPDTNKTVAEHKDINDEEQSIELPKIRTTATGKDTGLHITRTTSETAIIDVVEYEHLLPGMEYSVYGTLMNKKTNTPFKNKKGENVTAVTTFTPETSTGEVKLRFELDPVKVAGTTAVAFEELYLGRDLNKTPMADHKDITDEDQSVQLPKIATKAKIKKMKVTDTVAYKNLQVGEEYVMVGVLMDKSTGKPAKVNGHKIKAEKTFTPRKSNGVVKLKFNVNYNKLRGKTLVAFEKCYVVTPDKDVKIATHEKLSDKAQTVKVPKKHKHAPRTGQAIPWFLIGAGLLLILSALYFKKNGKALFKR